MEPDMRLRARSLPALLTAGLLAGGLGACGAGDESAPTTGGGGDSPSPADASRTASGATADARDVTAAADAVAPIAPEGPVSNDPDQPVPLGALPLRGRGTGKSEARYYAFDAGAGTVVVRATAKNASAGTAQALTTALYDARNNRLCYDAHGNTTDDKTIELKCDVESPQRVILRLDLDPATVDYAVELSGPVTLDASAAAAPTGAIAGLGSSDFDQPTRLQSNRVQANGPGRDASYFYSFNAGPGTLTLIGDGRNRAAATSEALRLGLYTLRSERVCELVLGNTPLDKREVASCAFDARQPVILRVDVSRDTQYFRARFEGPHDFEPFERPAVVTIALDSSVLFDTAQSVIKPEATLTLHEAAERMKRFPGAAVAIGGHTDAVGSDASNQALSRARADAVKDHFVRVEGLPSAAMMTRGFGSSQPVADNATDAGRARNRRVDVVITPAGE
jgi:outer membrane protein OmpA-like peptidoglycan-associated protein